jgi:hypothetical protein
LTTGSESLADALKQLEGHVMESYVDGWKSYWKLVTDVTRDPRSLPSAQKEYLSHVAQTVPNHVSRTLQAGMQVYGALVQPGGQPQGQPYTQSTAASAQATSARETQARPSAPSEFTFEGFAEETLGKRFLVSNKSAQPVAVVLEVASFVPETGGTPLQVNLSPQAFSLGAYEEKVVECGVTIPPLLSPMTDYRAVLSASGLPSLSIGLKVRSLGEREVIIEDVANA